MTAIIEIVDAVKTFPGVRALDGVGLRIETGTIHALLGENGAGKSTLIKTIAGVHQLDSGKMLLTGREATFLNPRESIASGIGVVHQERNLIPRFSVAENIALEGLPSRAGFVTPRDILSEVVTIIAGLEIDVPPWTPVAELGPARMQLVEIGKALALNAVVLILDEPTASLSAHETKKLFSILRRLRDQGRAIVFVSHKLDEVFELCDRVTVLRDGKNVCSDRPLAELDRAELVRMMIGRDERHVAGVDGAWQGAAALELDGVSTGLGHRDVSLKLHAGEVLGLYGLVGAGRTELAKAIIGLAPVTAGTVKIRDEPVRIGSPTEALRDHGIGYVSEDRKREGLILAHDVQRNVAITIWSRIAGWLGLLDDRRERRFVAPLVEQLRVKTPSLRQPVQYLSGGNQQKVSVAKWLAAQVKILIVDEPTVGIDVDTKAYLHELILDLARTRGSAVLLISSDLPEMVALADRIVVMGGFEVLGTVENDRSYTNTSARIMALIHASAPGNAVPVELDASA